MNEKEIIARRIAKELKDGDVINLGIGLPTLVANYIPQGIDIVLQSENGMLYMDKMAEEGKEDKNITNAGGVYVTALPQASFFDSSISFSIIRGGHVDVTVLGALEIDETGSLASHIVPGKMVPGMGGAMDLVAGAKKVIIASTHTNRDKPKILKRCTLPLTASKKVHMIVTELGVMEIVNETIVLKELAQGVSVEQIQSLTEARLIIDKDLKTMEF